LDYWIAELLAVYRAKIRQVLQFLFFAVMKLRFSYRICLETAVLKLENSASEDY
jgi:hypothetical protein